MSIELSIGCGDRDLNRALLAGEVSPEGVSISTTAVHPSNRHRRFFRDLEFDVCEVSLASYLASRSNPEQYPFTAIPVFPAKRFRHSFFYKRTDAGVDGPADLAGKRVGISSWQTTANVWMRGIAREHYGLDLTDVTWYQRKESDAEMTIPDRYDVQTIPDARATGDVADRSDLLEMFFDGDLDAVMDPSGVILYAVVESDEAEFVFDDPLQEERDYYEDTGIHPPMHTVAVRDEVLEEHPSVAERVFEAFCASRDRCLERNRRPFTKASLTWAHLHLIEQERTLGPDVWEYGLTDDNRTELRTFVDYALDQGLIPRAYDPDELFVDGEFVDDRFAG